MHDLLILALNQLDDWQLGTFFHGAMARSEAYVESQSSVATIETARFGDYMLECVDYRGLAATQYAVRYQGEDIWELTLGMDADLVRGAG